MNSPQQFETLLSEHLTLIEAAGGKSVNISYSMVPPYVSCLIKWDIKGDSINEK